MESNTKVNEYPKLTSLTEIDLHALAKIRDVKDTFLTVYFGATGRDSDQSVVASRLGAIQKALPKDLLKDFQETLGMAKTALSAPGVKGERGRVIFASATAGFLHVYRLSMEAEPLVVWSSTPFLLPLARLKEEFEDYGLLLIDSQEARLFLVRSNLLEENEKSSIDLMNKHKKGGWSQMRYNRLQKGSDQFLLHQAYRRFAGERRSGQDARPGGGRSRRGQGPAYRDDASCPEGKVIGSLDISMEASSKDLVERGRDLSHEEELSREKVLAEKLKEAVLRGHPAAYGLAEVGIALKNGRVDYLLISEGFALPAMICTSCHHIESEGEKVPHLWWRSGGTHPGEPL